MTAIDSHHSTRKQDGFHGLPPGINAKTFPPEAMEALKEYFIAGWGSYPLIGTREQVVDGLIKLSAMGLDGVLLCWPRYEEEMREFKNNTYPLLVEAGLR